MSEVRWERSQKSPTEALNLLKYPGANVNVLKCNVAVIISTPWTIKVLNTSCVHPADLGWVINDLGQGTALLVPGNMTCTALVGVILAAFLYFSSWPVNGTMNESDLLPLSRNQEKMSYLSVYLPNANVTYDTAKIKNAPLFFFLCRRKAESLHIFLIHVFS